MRKEITIQRDGQSITVRALVRGGLALHRFKDEWELTHTLTGLHVGSPAWQRPMLARRLLRQLAAMDWNRSKDEMLADADFMTRYIEAINTEEARVEPLWWFRTYWHLRDKQEAA